MNATRHLEIPIDPQQVVGKDQFSRADLDAITRYLTDGETRPNAQGMIAALADIHKGKPEAAGDLLERFSGMTVHPHIESGCLSLELRDFPEDSVVMRFNNDGRKVFGVTRSSKRQIANLLRDVVFPFPNGIDEQNSTPEQRMDVIQKMCERAGLFEGSALKDDEPAVRRMFFWGGHGRPVGVDDPKQWYEHAKQLAYELALRDRVEFITGCGPEIMKAPFKGALNAYRKQEVTGRHFIGLSEPGILAKEAPNDVIDVLLTLPNIEMRMTAFIMLSMRGTVNAGGAGTVEEALQMLSILAHENNTDVNYPFDFVEPPTSQYMKSLDDFIKTCFGNDMSKHYTVRREDPKDTALQILEEESKRKPKLWRDDLYIPGEATTAFNPSFEAIEGLDLSRDQDPYQLMVNLRRFFSAIVYLTVKNPTMAESWGTDVPLIRGDQKIIRATDELIRDLAAQKRIPNMSESRVYRTA